MKLAKGVVLHQRRKPFKHGLKFTNYMWFVNLKEPQNKLLPKDHFGGEAKSMLDAVTAFAISRGDVSQCSFAFQVKTDAWRTQDGNFYREVVDVDLFDVGPVTFPAYTQTSVQTRLRIPSDIIQPLAKPINKPLSWYKARARVLTLAQQY